ncbi:MAG: O-methyltransferase [Mycoplasmatales bacterium]
MTSIDSIKKYGLDNNIPIIEDQGLEVIISLIKEYNVNTLLEIGTAIGYSSLQLSINTGINIVSIEREEHLYNIALQNIKDLECQNKISLLNEDALLLNTNQLGMFDCIYVDGAKSQYHKFLDKYINHLNKDGIIIFDNMNFHGFVFNEKVKEKSRNLQQLIKKIEKFRIYLDNNDTYKHIFINKGDGISVVMRKEDYEEVINSTT